MKWNFAMGTSCGSAKWNRFARSYASNATALVSGSLTAIQSVLQVLVGSHCEKESERKVSRAEAEQLALKWDCNYVEVSAAKNVNIEACFQALLIRALEQKTAEDYQRRLSATGRKGCVTQ